MEETVVAFPLWHYRGTCIGVHDGDTCTVRIDLGFRVFHDIELRIAGINAPELHGVSADQGRLAQEALSSLILDKNVYVVTEKDGRSFARYVGTVYVEQEDGRIVSVGSLMVAGGHAAFVPHGWHLPKE